MTIPERYEISINSMCGSANRLIISSYVWVFSMSSSTPTPTSENITPLLTFIPNKATYKIVQCPFIECSYTSPSWAPVVAQLPVVTSAVSVVHRDIDVLVAGPTQPSITVDSRSRCILLTSWPKASQAVIAIEATAPIIAPLFWMESKVGWDNEQWVGLE